MRKIYLVGLVLMAPAAVAWADDFPSLPPGPGRDVTVRVCSQCHSPEVVSNQRMDRDGWKAVVDQMANNGANATDEEFNTITDYLATVFPAPGAAAPAPTGAGGAVAPAPADGSGAVAPAPADTTGAVAPAPGDASGAVAAPAESGASAATNDATGTVTPQQ